MARYRKIDVRIHGDERFRRLSPLAPSGQALWFFLLTCPDTTLLPGLFRVGQAALAEALGWSLEDFRKAFAEVSAEGMAEADWTARVLWLPNVIKYDPPQSPNVVTGWALFWDEIPECALKIAAWERYLAYFEDDAKSKKEKGKSTDPEAFLRAFLDACPKPSGKASGKASGKTYRNQEQEQEQEQEEGEAPPLARADAPPPVKRGRKKQEGEPLPDLPPDLDTPEMRAAWEARKRERAERGARFRLTRSQVEAQFKQLQRVAAARGVPAAVACLERATANGYAGLVFKEDYEQRPGDNGGTGVPGGAPSLDPWVRSVLDARPPGPDRDAIFRRNGFSEADIARFDGMAGACS